MTKLITMLTLAAALFIGATTAQASGECCGKDKPCCPGACCKK